MSEKTNNGNTSNRLEIGINSATPQTIIRGATPQASSNNGGNSTGNKPPASK